jgi:hypothetical protein
MKEELSVQEMNKKRILHAIILNDYGAGRYYASWVYEKLKTIETRMRSFKYSGDIVICCGKTHSVSGHAGKALCIVHMGKARPMTQADVSGAKISCEQGRIAYDLSNWRYFNHPFNFSSYRISGTWQGIFKIKIPNNIEIQERQQSI